MKIDLSRSDGATTSFDVVLKPADIDLETDLASVEGDISVTGEVSNEDTMTVVRAEVKAPLNIDCSRCLAEIPTDQDFSFKNAFIAGDNVSDEQEVELDLQDLELSFAREEEVDLVDIVREQIILNLPAHPLCKEDCKGLCEVCGANLNEKSCDCKQEETDPRWAALKNLK
ncbi:MAG: DUF177 domain-containing protein [Acidobacteria bacterium]|nr:MAG: DUF177 domain-containing protein [Acidobacteriota bacterium]REK02177.1 MAG: DUF177 domain-containing protein [Acidobacteriota bacterium]REK14021.1 MAG: DUF177 domain-containing protein [Acidobacteriota bacterium]REK42016.1 MAG: DUF177 domain-containing protein [Acidobacteriota bacterium]